ncbi:MAG: hypothetical protein Q4C68_04630 [Moraxella sp.]|nr:hypothetical protein [Moraxella sp.]
MKTLTTQTLDNAPADLHTIKTLLEQMIDDDFVVLVDEPTQNYIQTTPDDTGDGFVLETRHYSNYHDNENDFCHYRNIVADINAVFDHFALFFDDKPINTSDWQDITEEFAHHIYIKTNINNNPFDYYLLRSDEMYDHIIGHIGEMATAKDTLVIYPDEHGDCLLEIRLDGKHHKLIYQDNEQVITKHIKDSNILKNIIANFIDGNMTDFVS